MKNNKYFLNTALAAVVGLALAVCVIARTFLPAIVLPQLSITNMVLLSLVAVFAGVAVAIAAAALSHLVAKAADLQAESDLTI